MAFNVKQVGEKFRVVKDGEPQSEIDNGGFNDRQAALDAAMKANKENRKMGTGLADEARGAMQNRRNRIDRAVSGATGGN